VPGCRVQSVGSGNAIFRLWIYLGMNGLYSTPVIVGHTSPSSSVSQPVAQSWRFSNSGAFSSPEIRGSSHADNAGRIRPRQRCLLTRQILQSSNSIHRQVAHYLKTETQGLLLPFRCLPRPLAPRSQQKPPIPIRLALVSNHAEP
jgi:hypothetical protein